MNLIISSVRDLGRLGINITKDIGKAGIMLFNTIATKPDVKRSFPRLVAQLYSVGVLSLVIIVLSGMFIGMVLGLQGYTILVKFGAERALGQLVALSLVRELGPVIGSLLFAGRAGSAMTAEIALMKTTEQLSSMEMMGVDPLHRVVGPRFWAGQIAMPVLAVIFSAVAILGGYMIGVSWLGVDSGAFWGNMRESVNFYDDVINGVIKSAVFGLVISWIAIYQGLYCIPTAEGIGRATTKTVVYSSLWVLGLDFFLTAVMFGDL